MTEKEEFIFIFKTDDGCELREQVPGCDGCPFWPCDENCIGRKKPITRQEFIKRMADAISDAAKRRCDKKFVAEAALNALLEGK